MLDRNEILTTLPNFYGTDGYTTWSPLFRNFVLTDGAKFIAEECDAYWLVDLFASHLPAYKDEGFAVLYLKVKDGKAVAQIEDEARDLAMNLAGEVTFHVDDSC